MSIFVPIPDNDQKADPSVMTSWGVTDVPPRSDVAVCVVVASAVRLTREGLSAALRGREGLGAIHGVDLDANGLATAARVAPDVVLVDLAGASPGALARQVKMACPAARLVAFALAEIDQDVFACAASGFAGYVAKDSGADEVHRAVLDAAHGRMHCAPHIAAAMFVRLGDLLCPAPAAAPFAPLTMRENQILELADQGRSNKEIARQLRISCATVKNHMHSILQKLQVSRRGEAAARRRGARTAA